MREVCLDSETTGLSVHQGHRMVSLGVVELIDGRLTGRDREWFFNPRRKCDPGAFAVHGLPDWWLEKQELFATYRRDIEDFIGDARIVAHNAAFDRGFVNLEFGKATGLRTLTDSDANRYPREQWKDSAPIARKIFPGQDNSLDALADRFGINRAHRRKHGALKDARILAEIYIELLRGGQGSLFDGMEMKDAGPNLDCLPTYDYSKPRKFVSRITSAEKKRWQQVWGKTLGKTGVWSKENADGQQEN